MTTSDPRTQRIEARAEQQRLNAASRLEIERGRLQLDRQRQLAREQAKRERKYTRQQAWKTRRAAVENALPTIGRRVMIAGPILAPMTVAWVGQISFANHTLGWPLLAAVVFAASWELTTAFAGWMYHQARQDGDRGSVFRVATWLFAASAGAMNYWHACPVGVNGSVRLAPTPKAVSYGTMSLVGIALWELYASLIHRKELRRRGLMSSARPRFGAARWVRYPGITWMAWSLSIRDGLTTVEEAWAAAIAEPRNKTKKIKPNAIPVMELATETEPEGRQLGDSSAPSPVANTAPADSASERQNEPPIGDSETPPLGDNTDRQPAPGRRQQSARVSAKNRRSMDEWVEVAGPIYHAEFDRLRRQPTGYEFAAAIKKAKLGNPSASTAKNIRAEILDRSPLPSLDDETTAEETTG